MKEVGGKISDVGEGLTKGITVPVAAVGAASVAAWKEVDEALDAVTQKTGASGAALEDMQKRAKSIAETIPTDFQTAGDAVGEVNTRFGLTGDALEDLSKKFVEFASPQQHGRQHFR
jgi:phage-related minor tail protein